MSTSPKEIISNTQVAKNAVGTLPKGCWIGVAAILGTVGRKGKKWAA